MGNWNKRTIGVLAVVLAVAVAGGAYATWGGDGAGPDATTQSERQANPGGALGGDDAGIAASCIEGAVDCVDTPLGGDGQGTALGMCAPGVTDCVDMVVGEDADCAADVACGPDVLCDDGSAADGCATSPACIPAEPAIEPEATMTPDEFERRNAACAAQAVDCDDAAGLRCLPPDCAVSSDGEIACPDGGGGAGDGGASPGANADAGGGSPDQTEPSAPGAAR